MISPCSSQSLNHPELPATERTSTQTASKVQGKSTRGKRKRKKEEQSKEAAQEKGSRKTAGIPSSLLPGIKLKDLEQSLACFILFLCVKEAEVGEHKCWYYVLTYLERFGQQEHRIMATLPAWLQATSVLPHVKANVYNDGNRLCHYVMLPQAPWPPSLRTRTQRFCISFMDKSCFK